MLTLDDGVEARAFADAVGRFAADTAGADDGAETFPWSRWRGLADLGVLGLGTADVGGGVGDLVAVMERLGEALFPGPLVGTVIAVRLLDPVRRDAVAAGTALATVAGGHLVPWGTIADHVVVIDGGTAWRAEPGDAWEAVATLGGEPWARGTLRRTESLAGDVEGAVATGDAALAAYLVGAGTRVVRASAEYAATRRQFGQAIGDFQAVAHPLATVLARLVASRSVVRMAARALDDGDADAPALAASARLGASDAALAAVAAAHQTHGAIGFTVEAGLGHVSSRVRQWSLLPPGPHRSRDTLLRHHTGTDHTKEHR